MTDSTDNARGLDLERLISWGFAPGSYSGFCSECGKQHIADKRAWRCLECAERRADLAPTPQDDPRVLALAEALRDMVTIAKNDRWDAALTGRDMILQNALTALAAFDTTDTGGRTVYEPYPGAFDDILGPDTGGKADE